MQSDLALLHQVSASAGLLRPNDQVGIGRNDVASELAELQRLRAEKAAREREREGRGRKVRVFFRFSDLFCVEFIFV